MGKKGVTKDEKLQRTLEFFHKQLEPFSMKDLETKVAKAASYPSQVVKDIVMELVSDNLVETDKIGAGVYYWSFPAKAHAQATAKVQQLQASVEEQEAKLASQQKRLAQLQKEKPSTAEHTAKKQKLQALKEKNSKLDAELAVYADNDPKRVDELRKAAEECKVAANRWTDNLETGLYWVKEKRGFDSGVMKELHKHLGIPPELEPLV